MVEKFIKYGLFIFLFIALFTTEWYWPAIGPNDPNWQGKQLGGEYERKTRPDWQVKSWLKEEFQSDYEAFLKTESPNASTFIRFRNQIYFNAFNAIAAETYTLGKDQYLHQTDYCDEYTGRRFLGEEKLDAIVNKVERVYQELQKRGKQLLLVFPPGKPRVMPETLPDFYSDQKFAPSNWQVICQLLKEKNIPTLNHSDFIEQIDQHEHPIYPQLGLHWSYYGATIAFEKMIQEMESLLKRPMPTAKKIITYSSDLSDDDQELLNGSNIQSIAPILPMPYPNIQYLSDSTIQKPRVIVIGDSFYKLQYKIGLHQGFFHPSSIFRYYYDNVMTPDTSLKGKHLAKAVDQAEIIIFSQAETNIGLTSFGFADELLKLFDGKEL